MKMERSASKISTTQNYFALTLMVIGFSFLAPCEKGAAQFAANDRAGLGVMEVPSQKTRIAIQDCRELRLREIIKTYKDSAICSNPKILAAWQDAGYPNMDLINIWLKAREIGSENVDSGRTTPDEFEKQIAELTSRIKVEEAKRQSKNSGSLDNITLASTSPNSDLLSGLPSLQSSESAETLDQRNFGTAVVTQRSAAESKQKNYEASVWPPIEKRTRQTAEAPSTKLAATNRASESRGGVGGPYVPVNISNSRSSTIDQSSDVAGTAFVQLASHRGQAEAEAAFQQLQLTYPNILGKKKHVIRTADLGTKGVFYRTQIGPFTAERADRICNQLKSAGGDCFIQRN
ncbi:MAG: SPOR domain-containing protein [Afipia sp.]|nr:SPOR domain-containing protein [Afipia sp.]